MSRPGRAELTGTLTVLTAERDRLSGEFAAAHRDKDQLSAERRRTGRRP